MGSSGIDADVCCFFSLRSKHYAKGCGLLFSSQKWRRRRVLLLLSAKQALREGGWAAFLLTKIATQTCVASSLCEASTTRRGVGCFSPHKNGDADVCCFFSLRSKHYAKGGGLLFSSQKWRRRRALLLPSAKQALREGGWAALILTKMATQTCVASSLCEASTTRRGVGCFDPHKNGDADVC